MSRHRSILQLLALVLVSLGAAQASAALLIYETFDNGFVNDGTLTGGVAATGVAAGNYNAASASQVIADASGGVAYTTSNSMFRSGIGGVTTASRNASSGSGLPPGISSYPLFTGLTRTDTAGVSGTNAYMVWNDAASAPTARAPVVINDNSHFWLSFDFYEPIASGDTTTANFALTLSNGDPANGSGASGDNRLIDFRFNNGNLAGLPYSRDATHHVDFVGNVSSSTLTYGSGMTAAPYTTDVYVDGVLFANDFAFFHAPGTASVPASSPVATRLGFFQGSGSASSTQVIYIDNVILRDDLDGATFIPEPGTAGLISIGLIALGMFRKRRAR